MADLFGNYKRPNAEKKVIEKFIKIYDNSKILYKNKNYIEALEGFKNAYQLLLDIWDQYPKIIVLYLMMKTSFYNKQYNESEKILEHLNSMLEFIPKDKNNIFIKIKAKILIYQLILFFINDDIDNSVDSVIGLIKYLTNHPTFNLEDKSKFFWKYIKSLIKIAGIINSNKFLLLQEGYNSMIVEQININDNDDNNNEDIKPEKKVNRFMVETYKNYMNSKLRSILYEFLDNEFYFVKYKKKNDKVMQFLHKNINIFVRDNNKERLMELFHTFLVLNKTNLKKEYHMTLDELVFEQKRRIEAFDRIFSNLVGAFNHIFRPYFAQELPNLTKNMRKNSGVKSFKINIKELKDLIKIRIQSPGKENEEELIDEKTKNKNKKLLLKNIKFNKLKNKEEKSTNDLNINLHYIKEIKIPPNTEAMDKQILLENLTLRKNYMKNNLNLQYNKKFGSTINNFTRNKGNDSGLQLPHIIERNNLNLKTEKTENNKKSKNLSHRNYNLKKKNLKKKKTETDLESTSRLLDDENKFKLRNINNYLITKIIENFLFVYNIEHNIQSEETIDLSLVYPRKNDIFDFNIPNLIKAYNSISVKGSRTENQDNYFYYNNYFLIKNLTLFGVCDGHGKNGKEVSNLISILFPSYLFYILLDDNLIERKLDINKKILKLLKIQESPDGIKNMFLLRYFFNKFEIDFSFIPLITGNQNILFNQIYESLYYSQKDLKQRYQLDIKNSGTTLCSGFILGNILYIVNLGDSRAILGIYFNRSNKWKSRQLTVDHKPNNPEEYKRIVSLNGRVDRFKNEFGEEYGVYRIFERENESTYPGLSISRSIGDEDAQKLGVIYEPEVFKYEIKNQDKLLIIASDGLWEYLSNDEVINIVGNCYYNDIKCEEATNILIEKVKEKISNKNKNDLKNLSLSINKNKDEENDNNKIRKKKEELKKNLDNITCIIIYLK